MAKKKTKRQRTQNKLKKKVQRQKLKNKIRTGENLDSFGEINEEQELLKDMQPLFNDTEDSSSFSTILSSTSETAREIMSLIIDSYDLVDEPEFDDIEIDFETVKNTLEEASQDLNITNDDIKDLDAESKAELQDQVKTETTKRLLTEGRFEEIMQAIRSLRQRFKTSGPDANLARISLIQLILEKREFPELIPMIGLVQGVLMKSFWITLSIQELKEKGLIDSENIQEEVTSKTDMEEIFQEIVKVPGMKSFIQKKRIENFKQSLSSLYNCEIKLNIFTKEEISQAGSIIIETIDGVKSSNQNQQGDSDQDIDQAVFAELRQFVARLMTQERIEEVREKIDEKLTTMDNPSPTASFLLDVKSSLKESPQAEYTGLILTSALFGEIRANEEGV